MRDSLEISHLRISTVVIFDRSLSGNGKESGTSRARELNVTLVPVYPRRFPGRQVQLALEISERNQKKL